MLNNQDRIESVPFHKLGDVSLVKRAIRVLKLHYPGYLWRVGINDDKSGGVMYIMNMDVNDAVFGGKSYGYILRLGTVFGDPDLKCVVRAGGEILERARLHRGRAKDEMILHIDGIKDNQQPVRIEQ